eukprot:2489588-Rhodomonas_salina.1
MARIDIAGMMVSAAIPTDEPSGKDVLKSTVRACYRKGTFTDEVTSAPRVTHSSWDVRGADRVSGYQSAGADVFGLLVKVLEDPKQSKVILLSLACSPACSLALTPPSRSLRQDMHALTMSLPSPSSLHAQEIALLHALAGGAGNRHYRQVHAEIKCEKPPWQYNLYQEHGCLDLFPPSRARACPSLHCEIKWIKQRARYTLHHGRGALQLISRRGRAWYGMHGTSIAYGTRY